MAKEKTPPPVNQLQFKDLTPEGRQAAEKIVYDFGTKVPDLMRKKAGELREQADRAEKTGNPSQMSNAKTYRFKANRLEKAAVDAPSSPITLEGAASRRVAAVEAAATKHRMPDESIGGANFYYQSHKQISGENSDNLKSAITSSSVLSQGVSVEQERNAMNALRSAHQGNKTIFMHPSLVNSLKAHSNVDVPSNQFNKEVAVKDVHPDVLAAMSNPIHRDLTSTHARGIDFKAISNGASVKNISKAISAIRGQDVQNPMSSPKTSTYTAKIEGAVPGTPEHEEYKLRAAHLGAAIRGEVHGGQGMLDYYGLRGSNEGNLSNEATTVEDSWMHSLNVGHPNPKIAKAGGDIAPSVKTANINGKKVSVHGSAEVKPTTVYHAFGNEATNTAAKMLQEKHNLNYTVPSMLVQETAWRGVRAGANKDPELNKRLREAQEPKERRTKKPKQGELF